jgi:cysteine desulfurase
LPDRIYLDHAATSPLRPEAKAAMEEGFRIWANPSSPHAEGRKARAALEDARERIKKALGWDGELVFTSGASEALAIGLGRAKVERRIVSAVEHDAVFRAAPDAAVIPILLREDKVPELDLDWLEDALSVGGNAVVSVQSVNSETGSYMFEGPEGLLTTIVREAGGLLLSDCSQSAGKFALSNADMVVISAHKFGGPIGIGALLVRDLAMLHPAGGQERGYRPGTENLPGAVGMAAALECGQLESWATSFEQQIRFRNAVVDMGREIVAPWQCPYIQALTHATMSAQALLIRLDAMGFAVSAGSACSSGSLKPSRVLKAFGIDDNTASRTIRVSIGWNTTLEELDAFANAWAGLQ